MQSSISSEKTALLSEVRQRAAHHPSSEKARASSIAPPPRRTSPWIRRDGLFESEKVIWNRMEGRVAWNSRSLTSVLRCRSENYLEIQEPETRLSSTVDPSLGHAKSHACPRFLVKMNTSVECGGRQRVLRDSPLTQQCFSHQHGNMCINRGKWGQCPHPRGSDAGRGHETGVGRGAETVFNFRPSTTLQRLVWGIRWCDGEQGTRQMGARQYISTVHSWNRRWTRRGRGMPTRVPRQSQGRQAGLTGVRVVRCG